MHIDAYLLDDEQISLYGIEQLLLRTSPYIHHVYSFTSPKAFQDALAAAPSLSPAVALIDIQLNGHNQHGLHICQEVHDMYPELRIAIISQHSEYKFGAEAWLAGADAYIEKNACNGGCGLITQAVESLYKGQRFFKHTGPENPVQLLTPDELLLLETIGLGYDFQECAEKFCVTTSAIRGRWNRVCTKLRVETSEARRIGIALAHNELPAADVVG